MNLFNHFRKSSHSIARWVGAQSYRPGSPAAGKSAGKFKKGTMLDEKVG